MNADRSGLLPLLPARDWNATLAKHAGQDITFAEFLRDIHAAAPSIPADAQVINLCADRYLFAVGIFAAILRNSISLLPNAVTPETIASLLAVNPRLTALVEANGDTRGLPAVVLTHVTHGDLPQDVPQIPAARVVARLYTSGSTGKPQPHDKTWGKLNTNIRLAAQAQWQRTGGMPCATVATVPAQHMFGFESSVLLPLIGGGILMAQHPFFPADVIAALAEAPQPRALISTPYHLRALIESCLPVPPTDLVISATAPLSLALAQTVESTTGGVLGEIYGSTETGQIATRRTTQGPEWECFAGITLQQEGEYTWAQGGHIEQPTPMGDVLEQRQPTPTGQQRFILHGRLGDMINIAGKRTSLNYLNSVLCGLEGVVDGVFHLPEEAPDDGVARLAAFVVAPGRSVRDIQAALRRHIDAVFMPRPLVLVEGLPRNNTGKLTRAALEELIAASSGDAS